MRLLQGGLEEDDDLDSIELGIFLSSLDSSEAGHESVSIHLKLLQQRHSWVPDNALLSETKNQLVAKGPRRIHKRPLAKRRPLSMKDSNAGRSHRVGKGAKPLPEGKARTTPNLKRTASSKDLVPSG